MAKSHTGKTTPSDILAAEAFEAAYLEKLTADDIEAIKAIKAAADIIENSPKVKRARAEVQRRVNAIRESWTAEYGAEYPSDRNELERLASRAGVPAEVLFANVDARTNWRIWSVIEGYLLRLKDKQAEAATGHNNGADSDGYKPAALAAELGLNTTATVNKYAEAAGIHTPGVGGRNFTYPTADVEKLCVYLSTQGSDSSTRKKAKEMLAKIAK